MNAMENPLLCISNQSSVNSSQAEPQQTLLKTEQLETVDISELNEDLREDTVIDSSASSLHEGNSSFFDQDQDPSFDSQENSSDVSLVINVNTFTDGVISAPKKSSKPKAKSKSGPRQRLTGDLAIKKFKCEYCDKAFACGYSLTRHARIHTGEQCYPCDVCQKVFTTRSSKIRHDRTHLTAGTFKCEFCNKLFKRSSSLAEHQQEHLGQRPYSCSQCDKSFQKRFQLVAHEKIHNKPGKNTVKTTDKTGTDTCRLCGKDFPNLLEHLKEHRTEKALQSDLVDSSNDLCNQGSITPFGNLSQFLITSQASSIGNTFCNTPQASVVLAATNQQVAFVAANGEFVSAGLEDNLESNIIYVVGEDGTLQPQICDYSLISQAVDSVNSANFINLPVEAQLRADSSEVIATDPVVIKPEPGSESQQDSQPLENNSAQIQEIKHEPAVSEINNLAVSSVPSSAGPVFVVSAQGQIQASNLVIAQADTTSLDSIKSQTPSPAPSLVVEQGQDILALACKEFQIDEIEEDTSTPQGDSSEIFLPVSDPQDLTEGNMNSQDKKFHCEFCDKSFSQRNNLASHMRTHTGEKPFKCSHCEMAFSQRWSLTRHVRIHTGEKPFKCQWCSACFRLKGEKTEHEKAQHNEERTEKLLNAKTFGIGTSAGGDASGRGDFTPKSEANSPAIFFAGSSGFGGDAFSQSIDDSDSKSDFDSSIQSSSQFGENDGSQMAMNSMSAIKQEGFNPENGHNGNVNGHGSHDGMHNGNAALKFHYSSEEFMDTDSQNPANAVAVLPSGASLPVVASVSSPAANPTSPPAVLHTLQAVELPSRDQQAANGLVHHCDFCEASFASRTELVQHYPTHTG